MIIIDFKMKYESKSLGESLVEHHGKRGLGWHDVAILFYLLDKKKQPSKNIVYLDQMVWFNISLYESKLQEMLQMGAQYRRWVLVRLVICICFYCIQ